MRPIIDNDRQAIYAKNDFYISQLTRLSAKALKNDTQINVINPIGFKENDFIILENIGNERAEITKVNSIVGDYFYINTLSFDHENKTSVLRSSYDFINLYENNSLVSSITLTPDYYGRFDFTANQDNFYSIDFYNSELASFSLLGESILGKNNLLCSVSDLEKYEDVSSYMQKIIDKIDLASIEIRNKFISQKQNLDDLTNRELLRLPTALLALHYLFNELIKSKEDAPSLKSEKYYTLYTTKITEVGEVINETEPGVRFFGQSGISR